MLIVVVVAFSMLTTAALAHECNYYMVTGNGVNFRSGPGTSYPILGIMYRDDLLHHVINNGKDTSTFAYCDTVSGSLIYEKYGEAIPGYISWQYITEALICSL